MWGEIGMHMGVWVERAAAERWSRGAGLGSAWVEADASAGDECVRMWCVALV